jgi:hypothetical protein
MMVGARSGWWVVCLGFVLSLFVLTGPVTAAEKPPVKVGLALCYTARGFSDAR